MKFARLCQKFCQMLIPEKCYHSFKKVSPVVICSMSAEFSAPIFQMSICQFKENFINQLSLSRKRSIMPKSTLVIGESASLIPHPVPESASTCLFRLTTVYFGLKTNGQCPLTAIKIYYYLSALLSRLLLKRSRPIHGLELAQGDGVIFVMLYQFDS